MAKGPFVKFIEADSAGLKTKRFYVKSIKDLTTLGYVHWHSPWRRYMFMPAQGTIFDAACLGEIIAKIDSLMRDRITEPTA